MTMESSREISIGGEIHRIVRFRGLKATIAGALISRLMKEVPELQDRVTVFRKKFREANTVRITPAMAKLPRFSVLELTSEDFKAAEGVIELPEEPDQGTILVNMFPDLFELASKELQRLFGLLVMPNSELEAADDADEVEAALDRKGKQIMRQGDLDELLELLVVGGEVFKDQMMSKKEALAKIPLPWLQTLLNPPEPEEIEEETELEGQPDLPLEPENNGHGETQPIQNGESQSDTLSSAEPSSTDLPPSLVGTDEPSSTESPGTSSSS